MFPCSYSEAAAHACDSALLSWFISYRQRTVDRKDLTGSSTPTTSWVEITGFQEGLTVSQGHQQGIPFLSCDLCFFNIISFNLFMRHNSLMKEVLLFFPLCRWGIQGSKGLQNWRVAEVKFPLNPSDAESCLLFWSEHCAALEKSQ